MSGALTFFLSFVTEPFWVKRSMVSNLQFSETFPQRGMDFRRVPMRFLFHKKTLRGRVGNEPARGLHSDTPVNIDSPIDFKPLAARWDALENHLARRIVAHVVRPSSQLTRILVNYELFYVIIWKPREPQLQIL